MLARTHDTDIVYLEVVAAENDSNNVLPNIMHVSLDSCHENFSGVVGVVVLIEFIGIQTLSDHVILLLFFHERKKICHGFLHHAGGFDHLRQEHLP